MQGRRGTTRSLTWRYYVRQILTLTCRQVRHVLTLWRSLVRRYFRHVRLRAARCPFARAFLPRSLPRVRARARALSLSLALSLGSAQPGALLVATASFSARGLVGT